MKLFAIRQSNLSGWLERRLIKNNALIMYKCGEFLYTGRSISITWQKLQTGIILTKNNSTKKHYLEVSNLATKLGNIKSYDALQEVYLKFFISEAD